MKHELSGKTLKESADMIRSTADNHGENHREQGSVCPRIKLPRFKARLYHFVAVWLGELN